jgi:glutamine cyclotransferase
MKNLFAVFMLALLIQACSSDPKPLEKETVTTKTEELVASINYDVISKLPHDLTAYTEGLLYHNNQLFESTGAPENLTQLKTVVGILDTVKGKIDAKIDLGRTYFGEGIVILNDKIYQLTYKDQIGFVYDAKTYKQLSRFSYKNMEGWGMTTDGTSLIMSDGTNVLTYIDPNTLQPTKTINVTNAGYAEDNINELEYVDGYIYANIWMKNYIVKIDVKTGKVVGAMDCAQLTDEARSLNPNSDVLNGIAYDAATKRMFITGKMFPYVYVLKLR